MKLILLKILRVPFPRLELTAGLLIGGAVYFGFSNVWLGISLAVITIIIILMIKIIGNILQISGQISKLQQKNLALAGQIQSQAKELQSYNKIIQSQAKELQSHNKIAQSQAKELQSHNKIIQSQAKELQSQHKIMQSQATRQQAQNEKVHELQETLDATVSPLKHKLDNFELDIDTVRVGVQHFSRTGMFPHKFHSNVSFDPEISVLTALAKNTKSKKAIDVGAHRGEFTAMLRKLGFSVDTFEPIPELINELKVRFADDKSVKIHPFACSNKTGKQEMFVANSKDGHFDKSLLNTLIPHSAFQGLEFNSSVLVDTTTLDEVFKAKKVINFGLLKIDTEGHDLSVLTGAKNIKAENLFVEFWEKEFVFNNNEVLNTVSDFLGFVDRDHFQNFIIMWRGGQKNDFGFAVNSTDIESTCWGNVLFLSDSKTFEDTLVLINKLYGSNRVTGA